MSTKYSVVRLDDVRSIYVGHIHSVVNEDGILQNGNIGVVGGLLENERELRGFTAPTGTTQPVALVAAPEINYEQYRRADAALENFYIPIGKPVRAYELERKDIFSVSLDGVTTLDEDIEVGAKVTTAAGSFKPTEVASPTGNEAFLGEVIAREKIGTATVVGQAGTISRVVDFVVIEVIKNEG